MFTGADGHLTRLVVLIEVLCRGRVEMRGSLENILLLFCRVILCTQRVVAHLLNLRIR